MCWGERRGAPHGHVWAMGGSPGRNLETYVPVKAWSTATWSAVDVVRREYVYFLTLRPLSSFFRSNAACHSGWLLPSGGCVSAWLYAKLLGFSPVSLSLCALCQSRAH